MRTVAAAIKEDLSKVKDVLDIFARRGGGRIAELAPQLDLLKKISDTLGVLGLGELRQRVQQEVTELSALLASTADAAEDALLKVAGVLLSVEDSLDDQLVRLILPTSSDQAPLPAADAGDADSNSPGQRGGAARMHRQSGAHQRGVSIAVQKPGDFPPQGLDNVPQLLRGITAGLLMLGKGRAVELMDAIGTAGAQAHRAGRPCARRAAPGARGRRDRQHRVLHGDAAERPQRSLVHARQRRDLHQGAGCGAVTRVPSVDLASTDHETTVSLDYQATVQIDYTAPASPPPAVQTQAPPPDPQLLELFVEEAKEKRRRSARPSPCGKRIRWIWTRSSKCAAASIP
jgi:chemosensory pili system protein ChpA (sensor histidine kinase/response regulator)